MNEPNRKTHWETVYATKGENEVSWFQDSPAPSLELIDFVGIDRDSYIVDIGGGASRLVDRLLAGGFAHLSVLDISAAALDVAKARLGARASQVQWIVTDVTQWQPEPRFDLWHDRAAFHFLVDPADRAAYVARLTRALLPGGHAIIATFAKDGPEKCSGLPVHRYDAEELAGELGEAFTLIDTSRHDHVTPWHSNQRFQFSVFQKRSDPAP
ncbi:MAG TPA: class I SAM-dependent methyltransferase [Bradyrhizobium sp.]|nr:class I SAM-dependent methyltransferase [Bradyrhizobium sp.]